MNRKINALVAIIMLSLVSLAGCATNEANRNMTNTNRATQPAASPTAQADHGGSSSNNTNGADHSAMNHEDHANMQSSPNAASAPYDLQFLDTMIAHHQGAVDMARMSAGQAAHDELKTFSQSVIADQEREIRQMREWRERWFAGRAPAVNMDLRGMRESMQGMDMNALSAARGNDFDVMFIRQMIPHHDGALVMSREAIERAEHTEIKRLAEQIIASQAREIQQMRAWQSAWE